MSLAKKPKIKFLLLLLLFGFSTIINGNLLAVKNPSSSSERNSIQPETTDSFFGIQEFATKRDTFPSEAIANNDLWILKKGINFIGYTHSIPFPVINGTEEHSQPYWCSLAYNYTYVMKDLFTLKKMGVEHIRLWPQIYQFMLWDETEGYVGFNQTYLNNLEEVLDLADDLGFEITLCMMAMMNIAKDNPSYEIFYKAFDPNRLVEPNIPAYPTKLNNTIKAFGDFVEQFKDHQSIHTWEIANEAEFFFFIRNHTWEYSLDYIFLPIRQKILQADSARPVMASSTWFNQTCECPYWWYEAFCDYYDIHYYNETGILPKPASYLTKSYLLGELGAGGGGQGEELNLFKPDRRENVIVLRATWNTFQQLGYASYMPWEYDTFVRTLTNDFVEDQHCWRWDALTLYSFYTDDDVDFLETNYYVAVISEPSFNGELMSFKVFIPEEKGGTTPPEILTTTIKTKHPFYGESLIEGREGQILNIYFPPEDIPDQRREKERAIETAYVRETANSAGYFNATIYGQMDCQELPIEVEANTVETLNFTDYNSQKIVVKILIEEAGQIGDVTKWLAMVISNYDEALGAQEQFVIEPGENYLITLKDLTTQEEESWYETATLEGTLPLNATLVSSNHQLTISKPTPTTSPTPTTPTTTPTTSPEPKGINWLVIGLALGGGAVGVIIVTTVILIVRKKRKD